MFNVSAYLMDTNMLERFSEYLNRILCRTAHPIIADNYKKWVDQGKKETEDTQGQLSFYERMKIDELLRGKHAIQDTTTSAAADLPP